MPAVQHAAEQFAKTSAQLKSDAEKRLRAREYTLWGWEYAAGRLAHDMSRNNWRKLIAAIESTPVNKAAIDQLAPEGHGPRKTTPSPPSQ